MDETRLNKFLALHTGISRREADDLIESGRVSVNQQTASLGSRVTDKDSVSIDDQPVTKKSTHTYLLLHKPVGFVCSRRRQGETATIYELLPKEFHNLKPVGRLDKDSSGLILLTDDGDFAHRMTHPKFQKTKTYIVRLDKDLQPLHQQMISDFGVMLEDGKSQFLITPIEAPKYEITMSEGRNRQIRRTFAALGYEVVDLHRTIFGIYRLDDIPVGKYQKLPAESQ